MMMLQKTNISLWQCYFSIRTPKTQLGKVVKQQPRVNYCSSLENDEILSDLVNDDTGSMSESVWKLKPWWCQPYSIVLTGIGGVGFFWLVSGGSLWITTPIALLVGLWWYLFLIVYPIQYAQYVQEMKQQDNLWKQER
eukprot:TRINITY_DN1655_c0_g2_i4.p1 TRINITY_DN1655_c0_g2~~TRINITY_DN1655_c0_g2_i4.p1  ORF type:complete len:138 (+),score=6.87 TRINITY_DN1655_c0_g2_i4:130-543(+)